MIGTNGYFEKVSFEEFRKSAANCQQLQSLCENDAQFTKRMKDTYNNIKLPMRATKSSAGYDFYSPFNLLIQPGESVTFPTGIRCVMPESSVLICAPRSGSGFKYGVKLSNTICIVDADFYNPDQNCEGNIMIKLLNHDFDKDIIFHAGDGVVQGVILPFVSFPGYDGDQWSINGMQERVGGFGSTDRA